MTRRPILLIHGLASTHATTWVNFGWEELLADAGYDVVPFGLPGHGNGSGDVLSSADEVQNAVRTTAMKSGARAAMGFSAGAVLLMHASIAAPALFETRVHLGIGDGAFGASRHHLQGRAKVLAAGGEGEDHWSQTIVRSARRSGLDMTEIAKYLGESLPPPPMAELAELSGRSLFVVGGDDPSGPLDELARSVPNVSTRIIADCDHFRTTANPHTMREVVTFLNGSPS